MTQSQIMSRVTVNPYRDTVRMLLSTLERESVLRLVNLKQPLLGFYPNMYRHD